MKVAIRIRILIASAMAIAGYVVFVPAEPEASAGASGNIRVAQHRSLRPDGKTPAPPARALLTRLTKRVAAATSADALFASHAWYVPPPAPPPATAPVSSAEQAAVPKTPSAPPLPFSYMGSYRPDGAAPVFFLTHGDRVYNVRVGDTLDNNYIVDSFSNGQLIFTYKPLDIKQQLSVEGQP
jgi:hypothetical protein